MNPFASSTNKEKKKQKNFMMMRYSHNVRTKNKRSFREKQVTFNVEIRWSSLSNKLVMLVKCCLAYTLRFWCLIWWINHWKRLWVRLLPMNLPRGSISGTVGVEENALSESARDYAQRIMHCCKIMGRLARWLRCGLISFLPLSNNRLCSNCNVVTEEIFPPIQWSWSLGQASSVFLHSP